MLPQSILVMPTAKMPTKGLVTPEPEVQSIGQTDFEAVLAELEALLEPQPEHESDSEADVAVEVQEVPPDEAQAADTEGERDEPSLSLQSAPTLQAQKPYSFASGDALTSLIEPAAYAADARGDVVDTATREQLSKLLPQQSGGSQFAAPTLPYRVPPESSAVGLTALPQTALEQDLNWQLAWSFEKSRIAPENTATVSDTPGVRAAEAVFSSQPRLQQTADLRGLKLADFVTPRPEKEAPLVTAEAEVEANPHVPRQMPQGSPVHSQQPILQMSASPTLALPPESFALKEPQAQVWRKSDPEVADAALGRDARAIGGYDTPMRSQFSALQGAVPKAPVLMATREAMEAISLSRNDRIEVQLRPKELGTLRFVMVPGDGQMTVLVSAERPDVLDSLKRNIGLFSDELSAFGFAQAQFEFRQDQQQDDHREGASDDLSQTLEMAGQAQSEPATHVHHWQLPNARLDIRI